MKIYKIDSDVEFYDSLTIITDDLEIGRFFRGKKLYEKWPRLSVEWFGHDEEEDEKYKNREFIKGDIVACDSGSKIAFNQKAYNILFDVLSPYGIFYPVYIKDTQEKYYLFNVTNLVDALDWEKSVVERYKFGMIMRIKKHVFNKDKIESNKCFKIKDKYIKTDYYITEHIVKIINDNGLTGFDSSRVWEV